MAWAGAGQSALVQQLLVGMQLMPQALWPEVQAKPQLEPLQVAVPLSAPDRACTRHRTR